MNRPLPRLPLTPDESARLYWEIGRRGGFATGRRRRWDYGGLDEEGLLAMAVAQSRYDPRLLAILTDYLRSPRPVDPIRFKKVLRESEVLPVASVIGEFVLESSPPQEVRDFFDFLRAGVSPAPTQLFYRGLYSVGGRKMDEALSKPLWAFKKWGFLAADPPLLKDRPVGRTYLYDRDARLRILRELAAGGAFRLRDYLKAIRHSVSRQQALKDVRSAGGIRKRGRGKGCVYLG